MPNNPVTVSAFDSPEHLWDLLIEGHTLHFHEYDGSGIPPDYFYLTDQDLVSRWDSHSRSAAGLHSALLENAARLIEWKFSSWWGQKVNDNSPILSSYQRLVYTYSKELNRCLANYFSVHRNIEASCCYSVFLIHEQTLLLMNTYGETFYWESTNRAHNTSAPESEPKPSILNYTDDIIERGPNYEIKRRHSPFSGSCTRETVVSLNNAQLSTPTLITEWLNLGYVINCNDKTIFAPDEDGSVYGTDSTGNDFYAGNISEPIDILLSLEHDTAHESSQSQNLDEDPWLDPHEQQMAAMDPAWESFHSF